MRMSVGRRLGYAVGDMGINFYFASSMTYLLYFYTDVFGLSAVVAGSVLLVARIIDAITDPMMGFIADRTQSRWGKFRPYLLWGAVPLALITIATFYKPEFGGSNDVLWAYATYILFGIAYTVVAIPYAAMTAVITDEYQERTTISTIRMLCAFIGAYIVSAETMRIVSWFDDEATGFLAAISLYAVIATLLLWLSFASTREVVRPVNQQPLSLADCLKVIFANKPLVIVAVVFVCGMMSFTVRQAAAPYFFKYNLDRPDLIPLFFEITFPLMMLTLFVVPWLGAKFGKSGAVIVGAIVTICGALGLWLTPHTEIFWIFFFACVIAVGGSPIAVLGWAMIADTIDYAELKTGLRAEGFTYATASLFQKLAKALGGALAAGVLAFTGFIANASPTPAVMEGILNLMTWVPIGIMTLLIAAVSFYRLDANEHRRIVEAIAQRSAAST